MLGRVTASVLLALGITVASAAPAAAQMSDWPITLKAGINFSNLSVDDDLEELGIDPNGRSGLLAGVSFSKPIRDAFSVQVEALITQKGAKVDNFDFFGSELKARINYFEIPILGRYTYHLNDRSDVHLLAGPSLSFKISDTQELDDEELDDDEGAVDVASFDFGFVIGAALELRQKWTVDLRYTFGLSNVNGGSFDFPSDIVEVKNRALSISVGYRFK